MKEMLNKFLYHLISFAFIFTDQ